MSREQDLKNLKTLRTEIYNMYVLSKEQENLQLNYDILNKEYNNPKMPEVKHTPANNYTTLKNKYTRNWENTHVTTNKLRLLVIICGICLLAFMFYLFAANIYGNTQLLFHFDATKVKTPDIETLGIVLMGLIDIVVVALTIKKYRRDK